LTLDSDGISALVEQMEKQTKKIRQEILKLCWYMRGGLTYEEGMQLGYQEREIISEIINENLETTKKTQLPFF
jgi:DNA polymerase III delta subunit